MLSVSAGSFDVLDAPLVLQAANSMDAVDNNKKAGRVRFILSNRFLVYLLYKL